MTPPAPASPKVAATPPWWRRSPVALLAAVAVVATFAFYGWTLDGYFVGDDFGFIGRYHDYPWSAWPRLFIHTWCDGLWSVDLREIRPLNALAFMIDGRLWGADPVGYRVTNLLLHAVSSLLVGLIARRASGGDLLCALAATLVFALHPVQSSAVVWITGRVDLLSTLFFLGAFLAFVRHRQDGPRGGAALLLLALAVAGALFTKESGMTFPALMVAADLLWLRPPLRRRERATWTPYVASGAVVVVYLLCRRLAFGTGSPTGIGRGIPDLFNAHLVSELALRQAGYLSHLFLPPLRLWLHQWYAEDLRPTPAHLVRAAALVAALAGAVVLLRRTLREARAPGETRAVGLFGVGWYLVATLPLMVTYFSARHLYPATAGLAIAAALLLRLALPRPAPRIVVIVALAALCGWQLLGALRPWHDTARLSGAIAREVDEISRVATPGALLVLDVPALRGSAFCWSWAVPYALRPPFRATPLDGDLLVLEPAVAYARDREWHRQPVFASLAHLQQPGWLVFASGPTEACRLAVPAERIRAAAALLATPRQRLEPGAWTDFTHRLASGPKRGPP